MGAWCTHCANDHGMHKGGADNGCALLLDYIVGVGTDDWRWPEAWLPEPDDGQFFLPSRMTCGMFRPCEPCGGDPGAEDRAERMTEVAAYWKTTRS